MRILLLEDEASLAEAISRHLVSHKYTVDIVLNIRSAKSALSHDVYRAALFDLALPDGDALGLLTDLRKNGNSLPIVIITARDQISDRIKGLEAGADDYVVKPFDLDELSARLSAVLRRYSGNPNPITIIGRFQMDRTGHRFVLDGREISMTAKEWALIDKLTERAGAIVSRDTLRDALNGFDNEVASNTLEVYVNRLRAKLGRNVIETHRGIGYRFNGDSA